MPLVSPVTVIGENDIIATGAVSGGSQTGGLVGSFSSSGSIVGGTATGAVTGVVDRLERAGYARRVRDPRDRRKVNVEVTEAFMAAGAEIWGPVRADWDAELARMREDREE